ncbi:MAG: hypothetical protein AAFY88_05310, partial [Acidobacteriota bacterium]
MPMIHPMRRPLLRLAAVLPLLTFAVAEVPASAKVPTPEPSGAEAVAAAPVGLETARRFAALAL